MNKAALAPTYSDKTLCKINYASSSVNNVQNAINKSCMNNDIK